MKSCCTSCFNPDKETSKHVYTTDQINWVAFICDDCAKLFKAKKLKK